MAWMCASAFTAFSLNDKFKGSNGAEVRYHGQNPGDSPSLHHVYPNKSPVSFGLGAYSPFGLGLELPDDSPFRTLATEGEISYFTVNPVIAVQICRSLSIAAGFTANYSETLFKRGLLGARRFPIRPWGLLQFKGSGHGYGFTLGALWQPRRTFLWRELP